MFCSTHERFVREHNLRVFQKAVSASLSHLQAEDVSQQCFAVTASL